MTLLIFVFLRLTVYPINQMEFLRNRYFARIVGGSLADSEHSDEAVLFMPNQFTSLTNKPDYILEEAPEQIYIKSNVPETQRYVLDFY